MDSVHPTLHGAKILVVDDQPANLAVLRGVLETAGYKVFLAPNGDIALKSAIRVQPDLVLLDRMMPGIDGFEVCRRLKANPDTREIPVIFVTAEDQTESIVEGFGVGAIDYIPKPFRDREVLVRVHNAVYTKKLFEENRAHQQKLESELQTARQMQLGLMPTTAPHINGASIAGRCIPAAQVGGDFFRYFAPSANDLILTLADVTGHAMAAAIPSVMFNGLLESHMEHRADLESLCECLNRSVHHLLDKRTYVCFVIAQYDTEQRTLRMINAGCPYPLHYRAKSDEVVELVTEATYPLGVRDEAHYIVREITLEAGDQVVFYSDGITEASDTNGTIFGSERMGDALRRQDAQTAAEVLDNIVSTAHLFAGCTSPSDDQTLIILQAE